MNDIIDGNVTTKFGFVVWQPEDVAPMKKALVSTHKGAVTAVFRVKKREIIFFVECDFHHCL